VRYLFRAFDPIEDAPKSEDDGEPAPPQICDACRGTGYQKRTGIFEFLVMNDKIRALIRENPNVQEIRRVATDAGLHTLFEDGARLVIDGDTSIQELLRVSK
jgi:general secretion pathway protein E